MKRFHKHKNIILRIIPYVILAYAIYVLIIIVSIKADSPIGTSAMKEIRKEYYRYFLVNGTTPNDISFLSEASKQRMKIYGIVYDKELNKINYQYDRPYPMNTNGRRIKYLTLGIQRGLGALTLGDSISMEYIKHNAPLARDAGKL